MKKAMKKIFLGALALVFLFLTIGLSAGLVPPQSAAQASKKLSVPERGFISSEPGQTWEQGLLSGNGTVGASVLGRPLDEIVVFSHKHMFVPERDPLLPPATATRLFEIRRLIDRGLYAQAGQLAVDASAQKEFLYPDPLMPAFDLRIQMTASGAVSEYLRSTDFETGETTVHWSDSRGTFERRLFVSRADGIAVMRITGPAGSGPASGRPGRHGRRKAPRRAEDPDLQFGDPRQPDRGHPDTERRI